MLHLTILKCWSFEYYADGFAIFKALTKCAVLPEGDSAGKVMECCAVNSYFGLMVVLEEGVGGHGKHWESSSGEHEYLYQISPQS